MKSVHGLVADNGSMAGLITRHNSRSVPREQRPGLTTGQIMTRIDSVLRMHLESDLWSVLQQVGENDVN